MEKSMIKKASEELLRIADEIEKEASEKIFFACDSCEHNVNLATINAKRKEASEAASDESKKVMVASISVDDSLACPECDGVMRYAATEESEKYIVEAAEEDYDSKEEPKDDKVEEKAEKKEEKEAAKDEKVEEKEESKEDENPLMNKAASLGLDLDAVSRYSDI